MGRKTNLALVWGIFCQADLRWRVPLVWAQLQAGADRPSRARRRRFADGRTQTTKRSEGSSPSGAIFAPQTCIRWIREDPDHDAVMRIGGEAPGRRAHSKPRRSGHVQYRVAATSGRHLQSGDKYASGLQKLNCPCPRACHHGAARRTRPSDTSPVVASRQSAIRSLRASATIMVLRVAPRASAVRSRYHSANTLSF